ncbi:MULTISPECIES: NepR family anti-sigma factor [unclassified Methylobacterium]|uniref:NepR family anti-sigma factor n=1 Tax=unclassified Methylobacterium TaxID=2615210 RepID=UPI001FBBE89C|nr:MULTISPECIES: NepR family anti-sigma factor [unclassified Methylobacterium]
MAYVEPQHNVAGPSSATRGVWMADEGKEAGLRVPEVHGSTASTHDAPGQDRSTGQTAGASQAQPRGGLSEQTRNRLATQLRAMYDTMTQQPVPDRFAELIAKLDSGEHGKP